MTHTIHLTTHQAKALIHVFSKMMALAEQSKTIAFAMGINPLEIERCESVLSSLQKSTPDGSHLPNIPGILQAEDESRAPKDPATQNTPASAAP